MTQFLRRFQLKNKYSCYILDRELFYFTNDFFYAPRGLTQPPRHRYTHCRSRDQYPARLPLLSYHGAGVDFLFNYKFFRLPNRALISSRAPSGCPRSLGCGTTGAVQIDGEFFVPIIRWRAVGRAKRTAVWVEGRLFKNSL